MLATSLKIHDREVADKARKQGIEQGELLDKQNVLIRQVERKFGITETDKQLIRSVAEPGRLDTALDAIITAGTFDEIVKELRR